MIYLQYIKNFGGNVETLYDILEVSRKASKEVIEKAYKTLAKKYHPDLQTAENKEIAEKRMKEINEAYDVLSDEQKRKEYDEKLEAYVYKNTFFKIIFNLESNSLMFSFIFADENSTLVPILQHDGFYVHHIQHLFKQLNIIHEFVINI